MDLDRPLATDSFILEEREGTTDRAAWIPLDEASQDDSRAEIVVVAIKAWHRSVRTS